MKRPHKIKRWLSSAAAFRRALYTVLAGVAMFLVGVALSFDLLLKPILAGIGNLVNGLLSVFVEASQVPVAKHNLSGALLILGGYVVFVGLKNLMREIMRTLNPNYQGKIVGTILKLHALSAGPSVVAIGGGTGLSTLLRGLKQRTNRITAVVTVTDDGGSSGKLIEDKGILPPGDIRNCLVALADAEKTMTDLFQHRFEGASGSLSGHSTGNLLIAAMVDLTGDFDKAVEEIGKVLAIRGKALPATLESVRLRAEMEDGSILCGETAIAQSRLRVRRIYLDPPNVQAYAPVLDAIAEADIIVVGPGSVFTSVIPPLLVPGIAEAIADSPATKVYVCNVMTQPGESDQFSASDHVHAIEANVKRRVFDYVLINKAMPTQYLLKRYAEVGQEFVEPDSDRIRAMGLRPVAGNLISETDVVRHDPLRIADAIMRMVG